jgi:glycosyltransferase involved in cell wall biosynthesis
MMPKVLLCHNFYQQQGGEDLCFAEEGHLLESHGHSVVRFTRHNNAIRRLSRFDAARRTIWNADVFHDLQRLIRREQPSVMHCTNTFPLISPAVYQAARAEGVAVVQSLHNYRLICLNACLLRHDRVCESCLRKTIPWPGVLRGCYRSSRTASAVVAAMLTVHRLRGTWAEQVDRYIALTEFSRRKIIAGGLPPRQVIVKPNFVHPDPRPGNGQGQYAVFIGRLAPGKGIQTLMSAWRQLGGRVLLKIIGDGPQAENVKAAVNRDIGIEWLGWRPHQEILKLLGEAVFLVMPSIWYETFGRTIIEAYAKGTPVVASRLGAMAELVEEGRTGLLFEPGNPADLALKIQSLLKDPHRCLTMRKAAREEYESKYTAEKNYRTLMQIYQEAAAC